MAKNNGFRTAERSYNAYYATNFCSTLWNVRYLEKNEQNTNKNLPPPTKIGPRASRRQRVQATFSQSWREICIWIIKI